MRIFLLLFVFSVQAIASDKKEWTTLTDCRYAAHKNNDGDSFHVRCGAEDLARLQASGELAKLLG